MVCWRCGNPIAANARWDLGHVDEDGLARGFPTRHPEHRGCNRATVTHLKQKLAEAGAASPDVAGVVMRCVPIDQDGPAYCLECGPYRGLGHS